MIKALFSHQSPIVRLIFLLLLSITSLSLFLFFASIGVKALWGFDYLADASVLEDLSNPYVVDANRFLLMFQHIGFFIVPAIIYLHLSTKHPRQYILLSRSFDPLDMLKVIFIILGVMPFINLLIQWNEAMHLPEFMSGIEEVLRNMEDSAAVLTEALISMDGPMELAFMIFIVALLPAIGEELIFRGIIQRVLSEQFRNYHLGIWVSAFLFSAMHMQFYGFVPRMLFGAIFGYMLIYSGNILYPMIAHFVNNFTSITVAYLIQNGHISADIEELGSAGEWIYILPGLAISGFLFYLIWRDRSPNLERMYVLPELN